MAANNSSYQRYDAFIIDSDIDTRMRLRQATASVQQFNKIQALNEPHEALSRLNSGMDGCDVIFLSARYENSQVSEFVRAAKQTKKGQDAAYIFVLNSTNQDNTTIANSVMLGLDGFLLEPYSVDQLIEITNLSARVKKERSAGREKMAISLMVTEIIAKLDLVSTLKALGHEPSGSMKKLGEACDTIRTLSGESFQVYVDVACKLFSETPAPKKIAAPEYKGASARIKRKMEEKMLADAERALEVQKEALKESMKT